MKNTRILQTKNLSFSPFDAFPYWSSVEKQRILVLRFSHLNILDLAEILKKTRLSEKKLTQEEERNRDEITFTIFHRIADSNPDRPSIDSEKLRKGDPLELERLEHNKIHKHANEGIISLLSPVIPSRYMRVYYQLLLETGFIQNITFSFLHKLGFYRESQALTLLQKQTKIAA